MASGSRERYFNLIVERLRGGRYPSTELLDRVEQSIRSRDEATDYLEFLFEKVEQDRYPSRQLLDRIERWVDVAG